MSAFSGVNTADINADGEVDSATGKVSAIKCIIFSSISQANSASVYDGTDATGRLIMTLKSAAGTSGNATGEWARVDSGHVYVDGFGTNWRVTVFYK